MLIDAIFALLMLMATLKGLKKGLIGATFSLLAYVVGMIAALKLSAAFSIKLSENLDTVGKWTPFISFLLLFIGVAWLVMLGGRILQSTLETVLLGWANRLTGAMLFMALYCILYSVALFFAVQMHLVKKETVDASVVYPYIAPIAPKITASIGTVLPFIKDIFNELEAFFSNLSNKMQH